MGSQTSRKAYAPEPAYGRQDDWPVFVCRQGAFLFDPRVYCPVDPDEAKVSCSGGVKSAESGHVLLPDCRDRDDLLDQPPLGLRLSQAEAEQLIQDTVGSTDVAAVTDIGPAVDKASNQDFALVATLRIGPQGHEAVYQFAAVADGVTSRTLWPERSSRLAAFAAWRAARQHLEKYGRGFSHDDFEQFRKLLVSTIKDALESDMALLSATDYAKVVPAGWASETYEQFKHRRELWYNSTLLVVLVGAEAGFVATCGDGGLVVRKRVGDEVKSTVLVHSTDDLSVTGVVSLSPDALQFRQTRIALPESTSLEIVMSTDGVDRTLRQGLGKESADQDPYGPDFGNASVRNLNMMLSSLDRFEHRDIDNVSAAVLRWRWPFPALPTPVVPARRGAVPSGQSVDDVNRKLERIHRDGAARLQAALEPPPAPPPPAPTRPPSYPTWSKPRSNLATGATPTPTPRNRDEPPQMPRASNLPPTSRGVPKSEGFTRDRYGAVDASPGLALRRAVGLSISLTRAFHALNLSASLIESLSQNSLTKLHFAASSLFMPNLSKVVFFRLTDLFNKPLSHDHSIEIPVNRVIKDILQERPTLMKSIVDEYTRDIWPERDVRESLRELLRLHQQLTEGTIAAIQSL